MKNKAIISLLTGMLCFIGIASGREIMVKGSDTMLNLVQRLAEAYGNAQSDATVSVTGGGSGVGINAIINRECDIANASRPITSKEKYTAKSNGVSIVEFPIAIDGLSVIVNKANRVDKLTTSQLGAIYRGEIKNWKEVGGANQKITLYGRQPSSGTYVYLRDEVLKGDYAPAMRQMTGNSQIVEAVKSDPTGIGYVGVGYARSAEGIRVVSLSRENSDDYISPLETERVVNGEYPISRALYQYTNGKPKGPVQDFIRFELSPEGQQIVEEEGFFPVSGELLERNLENLK